MSIADKRYKELVLDIHENGKWDNSNNVRTKYADGTPATTKSILDAKLKFDNSAENGLLTQKRTPLKDPLIEAFWIWRDKSNVVQDLRDAGCKVWNEWELEDGTIGKAYGWQLKNKFREVKFTKELWNMVKSGELRDVKYNNKPSSDGSNNMKTESVLLDQVDYLIYSLKTNPYSRRIKTTLWCVEDLDDMALEPCVYETHWQLWGGKLNLTVNVRSNDLCLGNPYNVYQYSILHRMIAQVTGHEVGTICFNIDNLHIYDRHMDKVLEQIERPEHKQPKIVINPDVKSFYDFTVEDVQVIDYQHSGTIRYEVAI